MRCNLRTRVHLPLVAVILTALAIPAAAQTQLTFKGAFQGSEFITPPGRFSTNATGIGTSVGTLTYKREATLNTANSTNAGSAQWTAGVGDTFETTFVGSGVRGTVVVEITEVHAITGGTGRFRGAQGSITVRHTHIREPNPDRSNTVFATFDGTINLPSSTN